MQETHVVLVGVATDVAMAALKLTVGLAAGSRALVADALHSLSDVVSDGVTLAGLRAARRMRRRLPSCSGASAEIGKAIRRCERYAPR